MTNGPVAAVHEVVKRFGEVVAVDSVSLEVGRGEIVGLLGANGAGKTTLMRILLGLVDATSGSVEVFGAPPNRAGRRRLGYLPQGSGLYDDLTVTENLRFVADVFGVDPTLPPGLESVGARLVNELSLGVRRRAGFAAATIHDPELLVLDEPTSGAGPLARAELWEAIHGAADGGGAVLVTTHHMDEAEQCDRLVVMAAGRQVAAGTVEEIIGDTTTVTVAVSDRGSALAALEDTGLIALPDGDGLRVPGAEPAAVGAVLTPEAKVGVEPASLEEAFIVLSRPAG